MSNIDKSRMAAARAFALALLSLALLAATCASDATEETQRFLIGRPGIWDECGGQCDTTFNVYDSEMNQLYSIDLDGDYRVVTTDFPGRVALVPWDQSDTSYFLNLASGELADNPFLPDPSHFLNLTFDDLDGDLLQGIPNIGFVAFAKRSGLRPAAAATVPWRAVRSDTGFVLFNLRSFDERSLPVPARTQPLFSPMGARLAYLDEANNLVAVEVSSNEVVMSHHLTRDAIDGLAWSTDGERIAISRFIDDRLKVNVIAVGDGSVSEIHIPELDESISHREVAGWFDDQRLLVVGSLEAQLINVDTGDLGPVIGSIWDDESFATQQWHLSSCCGLDGEGLALTNIETGESKSDRTLDGVIRREHAGRTPTIEWISVSGPPRSWVHVNYQLGLLEISDQYFPPWFDQPIAAIDNPASESDTSYLIVEPGREPIEIEAFNVSGACPNGDVVSTGVPPNFDPSHGPGRIHSVETGEILNEFEPQFLYCVG